MTLITTLEIMGIISLISLAMNVVFCIFFFLFFDINNYFQRKRRLSAFREGVEWGVELFSRQEIIDGKHVLVVGKSEPPKRVDKIIQEIKDGRWDDVYQKNSDLNI